MKVGGRAGSEVLGLGVREGQLFGRGGKRGEGSYWRPGEGVRGLRRRERRGTAGRSIRYLDA